MKEMVFVPSGLVVKAIEKGIPPKEAIVFHGADAGTFVPKEQLSKLDREFIAQLKSGDKV